MTDAITDADIRIFMATVCTDPIKGLVERADNWSLGIASVRISKRHPLFSDGFHSNLRPESHFYKRWFDFPDTGARGWAIIFQVFPPIDPPKQSSEYMCGWVPPERSAEADGWIAILNSEIHARLIAAGIQPRPPLAAGPALGQP